ncbi:MAG: hypothetical protein ACXWV0_01645 [Flavisolibacter sp.]
MPRQNFLSKESFVDASEKQAKESLLSVPSFVPNITLMSENKMIESYKFAYRQPVKDTIYHIDVSVLPLNEKYIRISMHGTYANGQAFNADADMSLALHDFESAINAALKGDTSLYRPFEPRVKNTRKFLQLTLAFVTSIGVFFLKKKLS